MADKKLNSIVWPNLPNDTYYLDADKVHYDEDETYASGTAGKAIQRLDNLGLSVVSGKLCITYTE